MFKWIFILFSTTTKGKMSVLYRHIPNTDAKKYSAYVTIAFLFVHSTTSNEIDALFHFSEQTTHTWCWKMNWNKTEFVGFMFSFRIDSVTAHFALQSRTREKERIQSIQRINNFFFWLTNNFKPKRFMNNNNSDEIFAVDERSYELNK